MGVDDGERIYGLEAIYPRKSKRVADVLVRQGKMERALPEGRNISSFEQ